MQPNPNWLVVKCPNCSKQFSATTRPLDDGAEFTCPDCDAEITITMTWELPGPESAA